MSIVGCYSLHLYCDRVEADRPKVKTAAYEQLMIEHRFANFSGDPNYVVRGPHPAEYTGSNERQCIQEAKAHGWYIHGKKVLCPACAKEAGKT